MNVAPVPRWFLRLIKHLPQIAYVLGLGFLVGRLVLFLTTIGRKSRQLCVTSPQDEERSDDYSLGSARGAQADQHTSANPQVRVKNRRFKGHTPNTPDPGRIADYLEFRLQCRPRLIKVMLRAEGLRGDISREQLEQIAHQLAISCPVKET